MLPYEREILKRTVEGLLALPSVTGLHVDDGGDEDALHNCSDFDQIYEACDAVDDCRLYVTRCGHPTSFIWFIWGNGNDGLDCITDYGVSLEPVMGPISDWINEQ